MRVRVRLGAGLTRFAAAPLLSLELDDGATIAQLLERLTAREPALEPALPSVLPVVHGTHAARDDVLTRSRTGCSARTCRCSARSPTAATSSSTPRPDRNPAHPISTHTVGVTVDKEAAEAIARDAARNAQL